MNDLEAKLRSLTFREPPPGWRGSMVGTAVVESGWQKWLAPHPAAWAALAAIWIVLAFIGQIYGGGSSARTTAATAMRPADPLAEPTLFAFQFRTAVQMEPPL